jgi:hypothetical protein
MVVIRELRSKKSWRGLYGIILVACAPEIAFPVLFSLWNSYIVGILAMLIVTAGFIQVPLTWVLLGVLWYQGSAPKRRKIECAMAVLVATAVFLRALWVALHFRT